MKDRISITMLEDGIADVRLIRADKMNALDAEMWSALAEAIDELKAKQGLRVVVLSGEGRAFCAGLDLSSLSAERDPGASSAGGTLSDRTRGLSNNAQYAAWGWRELPVPVRTAVPATTSHTVAAATSVSVAVMVMLAGLAAPPTAIWNTLLGAVSFTPRTAPMVSGKPGIRVGSIGTITRRTGAACSSTSRAF